MSKTIKDKKIAIVLFNLGGPDSLDAVKPFLFNLFNDKYIITLPKILRYFLAKFISSRRENTAKEIYKLMGGKSSILPETQNQARLLQEDLNKKLSKNVKVFICMRHWHPMTEQVVEEVEQYKPDEVITLPLYPQFSTTTTLSSVEEFKEKIQKSSLKDATIKNICCYPGDDLFASAYADLLNKYMKKVTDRSNCVVLFSAHGLPEKIIKDGDPYQWQVELSVKEILNKIKKIDFEYKITYQSKVGPLKWIGPSTEVEIESAVSSKKEIVVVPVAFVSEHSETSVELDIEYKEIADKHNINYIRVETLSAHEDYINTLSNIVVATSKKQGSFISSSEMKKICPKEFCKCICN